VGGVDIMKRFIVKISINKFCLLSVFSFFFLCNQSAFTQGIAIKLLGDFQEGWNKHWIERNITQLPAKYRMDTNLSKKPTPYRVVEGENNLALKLGSKESASVLWRMLSLHSFKFGKIKWRWKVERSLTKNKQERKKVGDDYAARLCVIFEPHMVSWKTRAIHYVWAGKEPVGSVYKNPYAKSVATIVVESGNKRAGKWVSEERNFVMDYEKIFGKTPEMISGIAITVDTDNTQSRATAWFDGIILQLWKPKPKTNELSNKEINIDL